MASKSKTKGSNAERELAGILSKIFGGSFVRVPNSGSFTGGKNAFRRNDLSDTQNRIYRGDIITPDHLPKMVIESKSYAEFPYHAFLTKGPIPLLERWIEQSLDAVEAGDFWYVAFKVNRKSWTIVLLEDFAAGMLLENHVRYIDAKGRRFIATELVEFLNTNKEKVALACA